MNLWGVSDTIMGFKSRDVWGLFACSELAIQICEVLPSWYVRPFAVKGICIHHVRSDKSSAIQTSNGVRQIVGDFFIVQEQPTCF
jgi:hypothetical protein